MSQSVERELCCPLCGHKQPFTIWESINARENPELKAQVLTGEVFDFHCQQCGQTSRVGYPLLYHDPDRHAMFFMAQKDHKEAAYQALEALLRFSPAATGEYTLRAVTQPPELAEKILLMDRNMDDRVVELNKLFVHANYMKEHPQANVEHMLLVFLDQPRYLTLVEGQPLPLTTPFTQETYEDIRRKYAAFFPTGLKDNLFVDLDWAARLMTPAQTLN